jgi:hypothetical protein
LARTVHGCIREWSSRKSARFGYLLRLKGWCSAATFFA